MYAQVIGKLRPGDVLARTVYDERARPLLRAGVRLDALLIDALVRRDVASVYVRDGVADDVAPAGLVEDRVRAEIAHTLAGAFDGITEAAESVTERAPDVGAALDRLGRRPLPLSDGTQRKLVALHAHAASLVDEILDAPTVGNLASLKSHSTYTFQHSVDVAVVAVLLGVRVGLAMAELRELAIGALLHDVGKRFIDQAILEHPGALSPEQRAIVEEHPLMGFELVRRLPLGSILPAHVALQHHERQDGSGYPRGLEGGNRVVRWSAEQVHPKRMMLIAELTAVADVYSAIASDRPYRPAMVPERVADVLWSMAGGHLNKAIVDVFMRTVALYPVGLWVDIGSGPYAGWRGVVTALNREHLHRPLVRLVRDDRGELVADPAELDLAASPDVSFTSVNPGRAPLLSTECAPA